MNIMYFQPTGSFTKAVNEAVSERLRNAYASQDSGQDWEEQAQWIKERNERMARQHERINKRKRIHFRHIRHYERIKGVIQGLLVAEVIVAITKIAGLW